jgi:hypothetical protein
MIIASFIKVLIRFCHDNVYIFPGTTGAWLVTADFSFHMDRTRFLEIIGSAFHRIYTIAAADLTAEATPMPSVDCLAATI